MNTVLVTGSNGFTGRYVVNELLQNGYNVVGLVHGAAESGEVSCDLTDKASLREVICKVRPQGVMHLAALSFVAHDDTAAFYNVNVIGATNILEALDAERVEPEKIVIASSANIYGNPSVEVVDESIPPNPVNHYAASKLAMEFMVKTWFDQYPVLVSRPFNYTGVGQEEKFLIPKIVSHFKAGKKKIDLGNLNVSRDFSDVRDVARVYRMMLESDVRSEFVNICRGEDVFLKDVIDKMQTIAGYEIEVNVNPDFVRKNEIKRLLGDNSKLRKLIGYKPQYAFETTLRDMYNSN